MKKQRRKITRRKKKKFFDVILMGVGLVLFIPLLFISLLLIFLVGVWALWLAFIPFLAGLIWTIINIFKSKDGRKVRIISLGVIVIAIIIFTILANNGAFRIEGFSLGGGF